MERVTLYNKWRPQLFAEVVGQPHVTETIANALRSGKISHAYLFTGPRGTGKTSTARILAKAINCEKGPGADPCNVCAACTSITEGTALDVIEIDAASNRRIDEIRDLLEKVPYAPTALRKKVYIIDEVHQLTPEASSALLKTLEEPPEHIVFILATTEPQKLLATIMSRCQRFEFKLVGVASIVDLLKKIAQAEGLNVDEDALVLIAEHSAGSVRDAIGSLDQISSMPFDRITLELVASMLGEIETSLLVEMTDLIAERDTPGCLRLLDKLIEGGREPRRLVESLIKHLRDVFLVQNAANPREIVRVTDEHYALICEQAERIPRYEVNKLLDKLAQLHREMRWSENQRIILECGIVEMTKIDVDVSLEGLLFRIERLEKRLAGAPSQAETKGSVQSGPGGEKSEEHVGVTSAGVGGDKPSTKPVVKEAGHEPKKLRIEGGGDQAQEKEIAGKRQKEVESAGPGHTQLGGSKADRERARRALSAVLAELKRQGKIKTYAILMKAKVVSAEPGLVVLGFTGGASFSASVLRESGEIESIAEIWSEVEGGPVEIRVQGDDIGADFAQGSSKSKAGHRNEPPSSGATARHKEQVEKKKDSPEAEPGGGQTGKRASAALKQETAQPDKAVSLGESDPKGERVADPETGTRSPGKKGSRKPGEIAKMLQDEFGGEILK